MSNTWAVAMVMQGKHAKKGSNPYKEVEKDLSMEQAYMIAGMQIYRLTKEGLRLVRKEEDPSHSVCLESKQIKARVRVKNLETKGAKK
jgi:hypothetical protein